MNIHKEPVKSNVGTFNNIFQRRGILSGKGVAKVGKQIYPEKRDDKDENK